MSKRRTLSPLEPLVERIEEAEILDGPAFAINDAVDGILREHPLKDILSGTAIGHAIHPMLTDVVIGSFISATALDVIGGEGSDDSAQRLIALGIAAYAPTAITGTSDWTDGGRGNVPVRRAGIAHAAINAAALALYSGSLAARRKGKRKRGVALGLAGAGALGVAGYLGGHLTFVKGIGVDQTAFDRAPEGWTPVADADDLADDGAVQVVAGDTPVMVVRQGRSTFALHDRCSHRGCSLSLRGKVTADEVECLCHGSRFSLRDGALLRGPATRPQPAFEARVRKGRVEVRPAP